MHMRGIGEQIIIISTDHLRAWHRRLRWAMVSEIRESRVDDADLPYPVIRYFYSNWVKHERYSLKINDPRAADDATNDSNFAQWRAFHAKQSVVNGPSRYEQWHLKWYALGEVDQRGLIRPLTDLTIDDISQGAKSTRWIHEPVGTRCRLCRASGQTKER